MLLAICGRKSDAQDCKMNMLTTVNTPSYAIISNPKNISLPAAFTIEFWAQSSSFVPHAGLVERVNKGDTGAFSIAFTSGDSLIVTLRLNNGITTLTTANITNIQNWQHYAVTFTPNDSIRIFINGILERSQQTSAKNLIASTDSILIAHSNLSGATFTGNMDELRFWSIARSSAEILASMKKSLSGKEAGLVGYYSFDDDPATPNFHDFSGRKSEGTLLSSAVLTSSTSPISGPATSAYMLASKELSVIFPDLVCGISTDTIVHIYNRGSQQVNIDPVGFQIGTTFSAATTGFPLPADSLHLGIVQIHVAPAKPGLYRDTLIIPSTTICGGILRIPIELRFEKISIAFEDSNFNLRFGGKDLLPCDLPHPSQTLIKNTGTKSVTINSLKFSPLGDIVITSPALPVTIDVGKFQDIKFTVLPGVSGIINTTLTATTAECQSSAKITFHGERIIPRFTVPNQVRYPTIHLPPTSTNFDTIIILKNIGTAALSTDPALSLVGAPGFQLRSPISGLAFLKPDSSVKIKIRYTTSECGIFETMLHFQDQSSCNIDTLIPISITVLGPDVSAQNSIIDLGASCGPHDTTITLINKSGRNVVLGKPAFDKDSILTLLNPILPKSLIAGDSIKITIHFAPTDPGTYDVNARFPLSPCGDSYLNFHGLLGVGLISISDSSLDFGNGCDLSPASKKQTITNKCGRAITITNAILNGSQNFSVTAPPMPFTLANNESKEITITFTPQQLGVLEQARLSLYDSGCFVTRFPVRGVREKANFLWKPNFTEFGTVCPHQVASATVSLQNLGFGNDTIVSFRFIEKNSVFSVTNIKGGVIPHGSANQFSVSFSPTDTIEYVGNLEVVLGPCGDTTIYSLHGMGGPPAVLSLNPNVLDFGTIKFGTSDSLCTVLLNPSCIELPITKDSIHSATSAFSLSQNTMSKLPDSVNAIEPLTLCFVFAPNKIGSFETSDTIMIGEQKRIITLRGKAGISDLKFKPRIIDFGDVLKGTSSQAMQINIQNVGTYPASVITVTQPSSDFSPLPKIQNVGGSSFLPLTITFTPSKLGLQTSTVIFNWENYLDTIILRGKGIQPGLALPSSLIDFTKVRVNHDSVITVWVKNILPSDLINITSVSIGGNFQVSPSGSKTIFAGDSGKYFITYSPLNEVLDSTTLLLHSNIAGDAFLPVRGEGVEAHLKVDSTNIDFGDVGIGQTKNNALSVANTGGYPLTLTAIQNSVNEFAISTGGQLIIPPDSSVSYIVSFTPGRAIGYFDTVNISADAPEKIVLVSLKGRGVFKPLGIPEVTYSIPDRQARVGDIIDIPISIAGKDLPLFNMDSFHVDLSYDPAVVYFLDTVQTQGTLSEGYTMKFERLAHDSTIRISGTGKNLIPVAGRFFILQAEALLGPQDSTRIFIQSSDPINTANLLSSSGEFIVTDCSNYHGGIIFKGNYSVSKINPNPVSSMAHLDYEIGLPGRVHLDLYDALGRHIRTIIDDDQIKGIHRSTFSTEGIPSGEYIYVLKSLEYEARGAVIIAK